MKLALIFEGSNKGDIKFAEDPRSSARSKHLNARYHHIRALCDGNITRLRRLRSDPSHLNILKKSLTSGPFFSHRNTVMGTVSDFDWLARECVFLRACFSFGFGLIGGSRG